MKVKTKFTDHVVKLLQAHVDKYSPEIYWDRNERLSPSYVEAIIDGRINEVEDELWETNLDYVCELEQAAIKDAIEEYSELVLGDEYTDDELQEAIDAAQDLVYVSVNLNLRRLIERETVPFRLTLYSNFDCINSHWFETSGGGYSYEESYFGDVVDFLRLNPQALKRKLVEYDIPTIGRWPSRNSRKPQVDLDEFVTEMVNSCSGANLFVVLGRVFLDEFIKCSNPSSVTFPHGANCGFFSSFQGGGSTLECRLKPGATVKLGQWGGTKYDNVQLVPDSEGYSVQQVFGCDTSIFDDAELKE